MKNLAVELEEMVAKAASITHRYNTAVEAGDDAATKGLLIEAMLFVEEAASLYEA